jgi:hypothetical protein
MTDKPILQTDPASRPSPSRHPSALSPCATDFGRFNPLPYPYWLIRPRLS